MRQSVKAPHALLKAEIPRGDDIRPPELEHQEHLGRPGADPADGHQLLEHGGVVILHNCGGCSEVAELEAWVSSQPEGTVLISPYAGLPTDFAAVSWGRRLMTDCGEVETMQAFYDLYVDQAPESVVAPPPSSCEE